MNKSVRSYLYKGNIFNFIVLTFISLFQTAIMIILSLMLEKIMAIAAAKDLEALYDQGKIFIVLFILGTLIFTLIIFLKPKYQKKAITQYKNNIYKHILEKTISDFNKRVDETILKIIEENHNKRLIVITHGSVIQAAIANALKIPANSQFKVYIPTGSATQISYFEDFASLVYSAYVPI